MLMGTSISSMPTETLHPYRPSNEDLFVDTFDEFKAALQKAQARAKEEQAKEVSKHPEAANVKITPKIDMQETGATRTLLNLPTKEVKMKIDMQIESTDPKNRKMPSACP